MLILFFFLAALADVLSCAWHAHRETARVWSATGVSMALEALGWVPIWFALSWEDPWIAVASVIGSGCGTALGLKKYESSNAGNRSKPGLRGASESENNSAATQSRCKGGGDLFWRLRLGRGCWTEEGPDGSTRG